jgi:hypothetical protein
VLISSCYEDELDWINDVRKMQQRQRYSSRGLSSNYGPAERHDPKSSPDMTKSNGEVVEGSGLPSNATSSELR